jgi:uncharacterized protein (DUF58 family)
MLLTLIAALALPGALVVAGLIPLWKLAALTLLIGALAAGDALALRALPSPEVRRTLPAVVPVGVEREVSLTLRRTSRSPQTLDVHDLHPGGWTASDLPQRLRLTDARPLTLHYRLTPAERGPARFDGVALRLRSPLGLWQQLRVTGPEAALRVFPNFAPLARLALIGAEQASRVVGAHLRRRRGEGTEFQQLREYRTGDAMRQIDWKASQRARKLISREYQDEKNQQLLLLLDSGRRMLARDDALSHFDHALNATLLVAHMALRQGDAVGLMCFGSELRHVPPSRGPGTVDVLMDAVYDLKPSMVASDYPGAAAELLRRQPRRALLIMVTNVRDEDIDELLLAVQQLKRRHLVCVASLREAIVDRTLADPPTDPDSALLSAAMALYAEARTRAHAQLRANGAEVLDVTAAELPAALVEHYLAIKRAGRL